MIGHAFRAASSRSAKAFALRWRVARYGARRRSNSEFDGYEGAQDRGRHRYARDRRHNPPIDANGTAAAIQNGETRRVSPGDVISSPAGTPHWYKDIDGTIAYLEVRFDAPAK